MVGWKLVGEKLYDIYTNASNINDMSYVIFTMFVVGNGTLCWQELVESSKIMNNDVFHQAWQVLKA